MACSYYLLFKLWNNLIIIHDVMAKLELMTWRFDCSRKISNWG